MTSGGKKICKGIALLLAAVLVFSSLSAYLYYRDLKNTFLARLSARASSLIGQRVDIGDISFSLSSGIYIEDIEIRNPEGFVPGRLLKIGRLFLSPNYRELAEGRLHFRRIGLYSPGLTLMKDREARLNISDEFRRFLSKKGTLAYTVDELRIVSGMADFNNDPRYRGERIDLVLKDLSSTPGTRTLITGDVLWSGENRVKVGGWANLKDEPKKFRISVSAGDLSLFPFREVLGRYHIDAEKTRVSMSLDAGGDTGHGVELRTGIEIKSPGYGFYKKDLLNINLEADAYYDIPGSSATIKALTVKTGDATSFRLTGGIKDVLDKPAYQFEVKIDNLDLSAFNFMKGFRSSGILASDAINVKGGFDHPPAELTGSIQLKEVSVISSGVDVKHMNGRVIFSSAPDITARAEASAELLEAGGYSLSKPAAVRLSLNAKGRQGDLAFSAVISSSPVEVKIDREKKLSLGNLLVSTEGMLKGDVFSGKATADTDGLRYSGSTFKKLKSGLEFRYQAGNIAIKNPGVETEVFSASADILRIRRSAKKGVLLLEAKNLHAAYPMEKAGLRGLDLSAALDTAGKSISGDITFSAQGLTFREVKSGRITGSGKFNESVFSLDIPQADIAGGRIRLTAQGKTSQGPFPVEAKVTAEHIDLAGMLPATGKPSGAGYRMGGNLERAGFRGTIEARESVHGEMELDLQKFTVQNEQTKRYVLKDASLHPVITFRGKDCDFKAALSAGNVAATVSGTAQGYLGEERSVRIEGSLKETPATEIRNVFWDIFPDSLLYAGLSGTVSSDIRVNFEKEKVSLAGDLGLKGFTLEGENGEYSAGPVDGVVPFAYGGFDGRGKPIALPSFDRSEFAAISRHYADGQPGSDYNRVTIGSLQYGFRLLKDLNVWIKQDGGVLNVGRFSANIFGGRLNGSAVIDLTDGLHYRAGMLLEGVSLTRLCDDIEPIRGYISGRVDGIGMVKGSGAGLPELIGKAEVWTYSTGDERTRISREFLQKIGGPSIKSYLGDRPFDRGVMSLYLEKGFFVFRDLEISNRNLFGIQDLSVKVAPYNNRIAVDHLLGTIVEAAQRAKKNSEK